MTDEEFEAQVAATEAKIADLQSRFDKWLAEGQSIEKELDALAPPGGGRRTIGGALQDAKAGVNEEFTQIRRGFDLERMRRPKRSVS